MKLTRQLRKAFLLHRSSLWMANLSGDLIVSTRLNAGWQPAAGKNGRSQIQNQTGIGRVQIELRDDVVSGRGTQSEPYQGRAGRGRPSTAKAREPWKAFAARAS